MTTTTPLTRLTEPDPAHLLEQALVEVKRVIVGQDRLVERLLTALLADGVVPSNEDRGYILRRIMRRAIQQGHVLGITEPFLVKVCERVRDILGDVYPNIKSDWPTIERWARAEEEGFSRTLEQGQRLLAEVWRETRKTVIYVTHNVAEAVYLADRVIVMSPHPGTVKAEIKIALPRPRDPLSAEFVDMQKELLRHLGHDQGAATNGKGR